MSRVDEGLAYCAFDRVACLAGVERPVMEWFLNAMILFQAQLDEERKEAGHGQQ